MWKLWARSSVLIAIFILGLVVGRSGILPVPAQASANLEGGDPSGLYWNEGDTYLDLFNFSSEETYLLMAEMEDEAAWQNLGGGAEMVHLEGNVTIKTEGLSSLTVYRLDPVVTKDGPELIRPCHGLPTDCPAPGEPPVPPLALSLVLHSDQAPN